MKIKELSELYKVPTEKYMERSVTEQIYVNIYDAMKVNPLFSYFTQEDITFLNKLAISPSMHNKVKEKYRLMDELMNKKGFKIIGGGTNRRAYECLYDPRIVAKVSTDSVGFTSNLKEYINQKVLKPFCCKIYEVTPCGTLSIIEKVEPVKEIRDLKMFAEDVYKILFFKIRNKNIAMEDIGARSLKNWGYRPDFGPVLLDYPTMYVADPKKRLCNRMINGCLCNGTIDYDEGFDYIICTSCHSTVLAKTIAKENGDNINELTFAVSNKNKNFNGGTEKMQVLLEEINEDGTRKVITENYIGGMSKYVDPRAMRMPRKKQEPENFIEFTIDEIDSNGNTISLNVDEIDIKDEYYDEEKEKQEPTDEQNKESISSSLDKYLNIDTTFDAVSDLFNDLLISINIYFKDFDKKTQSKTRFDIYDNILLKNLQTIYMKSCNPYEYKYMEYLNSSDDEYIERCAYNFNITNLKNIYFRMVHSDINILRFFNTLYCLMNKIIDRSRRDNVKEGINIIKIDNNFYHKQTLISGSKSLDEIMRFFVAEYRFSGKVNNNLDTLKNYIVDNDVFESIFKDMKPDEEENDDNMKANTEVTNIEINVLSKEDENTNNLYKEPPVNGYKQFNKNKYDKRQKAKEKDKYKKYN